MIFFSDCCEIGEGYGSRRWYRSSIILKDDQFYNLVYDGPSDKHSEWIEKKVGGVQAAIVTVPVIQAYEEAFN